MKNCLLLFFTLISLGASAQCINTDPCNLVCNPHMEDPSEDCAFEAAQCFHYFSIACSNSNGDQGFSNWTTLFGSPFWFDASTTCTTNVFNQNPIPGDPGGDIGITAVQQSNFNTSQRNHAFMTDVDVHPNTRYILSFFRTNLRQTTNSPGYDVRLTDAADITWTAGFTGTLPTNFDITGEGVFDGTGWEQVVTCFTTDNNSNYNTLYFESRSNTLGTPRGSKFDNIELIEDHLLNTPPSYTVLCAEPTDIGIELCSVANFEYHWYDVTNATNPIQLTAFNNSTDQASILIGNNTSLLPYTVSDINIVGSVIEITGLSEDRQLELRRVNNVAGQFGIPINNTTCNNDVASVNVIADCTPQNECLVESWPKNYSSSNPNFEERVTSIAATVDGELYAYGLIDDNVDFGNGQLIPGHSFLAKYENCGDLMWVIDVSAYGDNSLDQAQIKTDNEGNVILLNGFGDHLNLNTEYRLTKFDPDGLMLWSNVIEQHSILPLPSFDIDQNTNEVYLTASLGAYLRIRDQTNAYIVNATLQGSFSLSRDLSFLVKFDPQGVELWQDKLVATGGIGSFRNVVVAENIGRVYVAGVARNSSSSFNLHLASDPLNNITSSTNNRMFLAAYNTNGTVNSFGVYSNIHGTDWMNMEFSNQDGQLYVKSLSRLYLFNAASSLIGATTIDFSDFAMHYDQGENHLLISGFKGNAAYMPHIAKYHGLNQIWDYTVGNFSKGVIRDVHADPTSNKVFIAGLYFDNDLSFAQTGFAPLITLPFAGGTDAFITRLRDQGNSAVYKASDAHQEGADMDENNIPSIMSVYPNPTRSAIQVSIENEALDNGSLVLFSAEGTALESRLFRAENGSVQFDLSNFPAGVYFIQFSDEGGNNEVKKFIKL